MSLLTMLETRSPVPPYLCVSFTPVIPSRSPLTDPLQGLELEEDDDGSSTVTNSTANLAVMAAGPAPIQAEELAVKLGSVAANPIEETEPSQETPEESVMVPNLDDSLAAPPSHDEPTGDLPSENAPVTDLGISTRESTTEEIPAGDCLPSEPSSDAADLVEDLGYVYNHPVVGTGLEATMEVYEDALPSQGDYEQDLGFWSPDDETPAIVIIPPSEVDPEDFAPQFDPEQAGLEGTLYPGFKLEPKSEEEYEYDGDYELEYADEYPAGPVFELTLSPSEVRDSPFRSPVIVTGMLWSDDEGDDLGPLPFVKKVPHIEEIDTLETEAQDSVAEEGTSDAVVTTLEDSNGTRFWHVLPLRNVLISFPVAEAVQEPVEELHPAPTVPRQDAPEPTPTLPVPPPSPPRVSRSHPIRIQAPSIGEDRGEGSSRSNRTLEHLRPQYFHCCKLYKSDGRPQSWTNWKFEKPKACIPVKTHLREWQFICPTDKDGENPTTRIAIDNLDADWFRTVEGVPSYNYLTSAMEFFSTKYFRCWGGRSINGVEYPSIGYATVDFDSVDQAIRMFEELQGRRLRGHTWHWRLEFVDPSDETHGGRKLIRTDLVPDSVKQALAAELEASTRNHGSFGHPNDSGTDTAVVTRPPARVRPQLSVGGRSLFAGAMANIVQDRRGGEQPTQSATRAPSRRSYRS